MTSRFVHQCGRIKLAKQPHRGEYRDFKTVSCIACRSLVAAMQKFLSGRPALNEETFLFLTKQLGTTSDAQHTVPRSASQLHELLKESATVPVAPLGHHGFDEQPFAADAWCSLAMLAALELPDVPFHVFLSTWTMTALQAVSYTHLTLPTKRIV